MLGHPSLNHGGMPGSRAVLQHVGTVLDDASSSIAGILGRRRHDDVFRGRAESAGDLHPLPL
jgi:hypothetical protein